ncbi:GNAT family N-acetyltransferase [Streptomyces noboritoensis]|uniref:Lysine N-acyltransferase MbtK n=1 Tax=Streptomyces noboritoensis TaxID=67337 RepID=A0ABV6TJY4_9ACTN
MPPTDASTDAGAGPSPRPGGAEDTLDMRLPYELVALFGESRVDGMGKTGAAEGGGGEDGVPEPGLPEPSVPDPGVPDSRTPDVGAPGRATPDPDAADSATVGAEAGARPPSPLQPEAEPEPQLEPDRSHPAPRTPHTYSPVGATHLAPHTPSRITPHTAPHPHGDDLLDCPEAWGPVTTRVGVFQLVPVRVERDLSLLSGWMNDPAVAAFWELAGPESVTAAHLRPQLDGDGRSVPCLGLLDGTPMSYWEIYRADLDPLARHYPARPHDTGIHLLIGGVADRGRGVGTALLRAVADLVLDNRPLCSRVVAEPDLRNTPSVSAFLSAGFRFSAEVDLPDKRAALMVRDRALRNLL